MLLHTVKSSLMCIFVFPSRNKIEQHCFISGDHIIVCALPKIFEDMGCVLEHNITCNFYDTRVTLYTTVI